MSEQSEARELATRLRDLADLQALKSRARSFGIEASRTRAGAWEKELHLLLSARRRLSGTPWTAELRRLRTKWKNSKKARPNELGAFLDGKGVGPWLSEPAVESWIETSLDRIRTGKTLSQPSPVPEENNQTSPGRAAVFQMVFFEGLLEGVRMARSKGA